MKTPCKRLLLLSCLLFVCSIAHSGTPSKEEFDFVNHYKNTSLVEDGLGLLNSAATSISSTAISIAFWYGICKAPSFVSTLASQFKLDNQDKKDLNSIKTDFCAQLAPAIAITETMLAGNVSPWPLEQAWWQTQRFLGAGLYAFANPHQENRGHMLLWTLDYFSAEATARSAAGAVSTQILRSQGISAVNPSYYTYGEYATLSYVNGIIVGSIVYKAMIAQGFTPAKASFVYAISALLTGALSAVMSISTLDLDSRSIASAVVGAEAGAIAGAGAGAVVLSGAGAVAVAGAVAGAGAGVVAGAVVGAGVGTGAGIVAGAGAGVGAGAVAGVGALIRLYSSSSNKILINAAIALPSALMLALINGFSNYAIYGFPLEKSLSETAWNTWKKLYAPLDYLSTLLN